MNRPMFSPAMSRRSFITASTTGLAGLSFGPAAFGSASLAPRKHPAKSTILFFLCGGSSHIDMWDMKPDAPVEYRGEFNPIRTSAPEVQICEHLPMTAKQGHHLAIVNGLTDYGRATGDHHAGYYYNLTGHAPDDTFRREGNDRRPYATDWPHMGCVIGSKRPPHPKMPQPPDQIAGGIQRYNPARLQHGNSAAKGFRLLQVMCRQNDRMPVPIKALNEVPQTATEFDIHSGSGFIKNNDRGAVD